MKQQVGDNKIHPISIICNSTIDAKSSSWSKVLCYSTDIIVDSFYTVGTDAYYNKTYFTSGITTQINVSPAFDKTTVGIAISNNLKKICFITKTNNILYTLDIDTNTITSYNAGETLNSLEMYPDTNMLWLQTMVL